MVIVPSSGLISPERILMNVLFPLPLSPTMASISPQKISKSMPRNA